MSNESTLQADLADVRQRMGNQSRELVVLAEMWAYHKDLTFQIWKYAGAKTAYGRRMSQIVVRERANGEKSATAAQHTAEATEEVHNAHLHYRLAEQMIVADREALRILHAELEVWRTKAADARMADSFQARTQT